MSAQFSNSEQAVRRLGGGIPVRPVRVRDHVTDQPDVINEDIPKHHKAAARLMGKPLSSAQSNPPSQISISDRAAFFWGLLISMRAMAFAPLLDLDQLWLHRSIIIRAFGSVLIPITLSYLWVSSATHVSSSARFGGFIALSVLLFMTVGWVFFFFKQINIALHQGANSLRAKGRLWLSDQDNS